jgi:protein gp37
MPQTTKIEWADASWNPVTGCTKVSAGCKNCYAEKIARRLNKMGLPKYENGFEVMLHPVTLNEPTKMKKGKVIFVNSMSDLFHEDVPLSFIIEVFDVMNKTPQHTYLILTKRSDRLKEIDSKLNWSDNIWMGVTVEDTNNEYRINDLLQCSARIKFVSFEPLFGPIDTNSIDGIDWAIVGGESGPGARPIEESWINDIKDACHIKKIPFYFKQWGGINKKKNGRLLNGQTWDDRPISKRLMY